MRRTTSFVPRILAMAVNNQNREYSKMDKEGF